MEPFFQQATINLDLKSQHSLRNRKESGITLSVFQLFTHKPKKDLTCGKRVLSNLIFIKQNASMTVEAAFVLPIFLFCVMNVIFAFRMIETQSRVLAALHQVGNQICFMGYGEKYVPDAIPSGFSNIVLSEGYARGAVIQKMGSSFIDDSSIKGGALGLSFMGSSIMEENDLVDIKVSWITKPFASNQGFRMFPSGCRYYGRAWTGYEADIPGNYSEMTDPMVYITEHGTAYHYSRSCYHLNPSISQVPAGDISSYKNRSGANYRTCMYCGNGGSMHVIYYITPEGDCFHTNPNCSGLKRTIYTVPLSQVGGRSACMSCW